MGAREQTFEVGEGERMTIVEFFRSRDNISLRYPDVICVEFCARYHFPSISTQRPLALYSGANSARALRSATRPNYTKANDPRPDQLPIGVFDHASSRTLCEHPRGPDRTSYWYHDVHLFVRLSSTRC
ncbi:hypothetical protein EI94DRAFT_520862 [Lactarius quietus]|nr:hypothetical protein EI94DRAFT_520862 [Lactarius quietus]